MISFVLLDWNKSESGFDSVKERQTFFQSKTKILFSFFKLQCNHF